MKIENKYLRRRQKLIEGEDMKRTSIILPVILTAIFAMFFLTGCDEIAEMNKVHGFGYDDNGILKGTVWVRGTTTLSFSENKIAVSAPIDFGTESLMSGTYYSYLSGSTVVVNSRNYGDSYFTFTLKGVELGYYSRNLGEMPPFHLYSDTPFINGKTRYYNNFIAEETEGGLMIAEYTGNLKNLVIPAEIGGVPVVAIGTGTFNRVSYTVSSNFLQLTTVIIPESVTTIRPGVFRSNDLFGYSQQSGRYLSGGITIGANVTIMGANAVAGWDQGWGALDPVKVGEGNFIAYEREHTGYWLDMGFVRFYNENGRKAGTYKWDSSYNYYNYAYTFTWSYAPTVILGE
jgi:hypothetical protein